MDNTMIEQVTCLYDQSIISVMKKINDNMKNCIFVTDENRKLMDVVTDGDIRRIILDGHELHEPIGRYLKNDFVYIKEHEKFDEILSKISQRITILPIVDSEFRVIDFFECQGTLQAGVARPDLYGNEFKYLVDAFLSTWISSKGEYISEFEKKFAEFTECEYAVAVSNGTCALHLSLIALDIGPGDEVIIPDMTFAATANAVLHAGATPVIVDIEKDSWCIDPAEIKKAITPRTRAILPVHLYGQPCNMYEIMQLACNHNLSVIEDCAEAHGAEFNGQKVGSFGDTGCFSFFANKVITTGEGGMVVTNSPVLYEKMRLMRDHGMSPQKRYWHDVVGYNYRMTNLQAAIGLAQLERIDYILGYREEIEQSYRKALREVASIGFQRNDLPHRKKITWLVSCLVQPENRDPLLQLLERNGIDCRPFFYPLGDMEIYKNYIFSNQNSKNISKRGLLLPTFFDCHKSLVDQITGIIKEEILEDMICMET